jgi:NADH-ubiquinone oxidoreductase chain 4
MNRVIDALPHIYIYKTGLGSLPLLVGILYAYNSLGSLCLFLLCGNNSLTGDIFYVCIVFAFLFKIPAFMVHL